MSEPLAGPPPGPSESADRAMPPWGELRRARIGRRLLLWILLASSLVTLLLTSLQLYLDYRRDVDGIEVRLAEIEHGYLPSLASSLWKLDREQLQLQLDGITRLPDILSAEVQDAQGTLKVESGRMDTRAELRRSIPLTFEDRGERRVLGELRVVANLEGIYRRLTERALIILASQGVKTFLISLFILFIVHQVVTRHLASLARYFSNFDIRAPQAPLALARKPREVPDELDFLVQAIRDLQDRLARAYSDLHRANQSLQTDIVARQRAEDEISRLNQDLERRVAARTADLQAANNELAAFTYSVSHDLRAPLRTMHGFAQVVAREHGHELSPQAKDYLDRVQNGAQRMETLIGDLLRLSEISQRTIKLVEVDLSALAQNVANELQAEEPGRKVQWHIEPGMAARGDAGLLRILLANLLGNAWKYTGRCATARIEFGCEDVGAGPIYFVSDNGVGFDMKYGEKLFTAFQRLHRAEEFPGTGIGLATVARIVHRHGGKVWAEGKVGEGARFSFSLAS